MSSIWTIRRTPGDAKLAGLCGGVAAHWNIDPVLVRVGWAMLALSGGLGVVLYLAGWLLIPLEGRDRAPVDDVFGAVTRSWPREIWVVLVVLACALTFAVFGGSAPFGFGPALVLAVIWYFGFYRRHAREASSPTPAAAPPPPALPNPAADYRHTLPTFAGPPTPFTTAAAAWRERVEAYDQTRVGPAPVSAAGPVGWPLAPSAHPMPTPVTMPMSVPNDDHAAFLAVPDPVGLYVEPAPTPPPPVVRPGQRLSARRLRLVTLIVLGLTLAALGIADRAGLAVSATAYAAAALLVLGLALIAATWLGRAAGLLPVALLSALALLATLASVPLSTVPYWGNAQIVYRTVPELPKSSDHLDAGQLTVDLRQLAITGDTTYAASVDTGSVTVLAPPDAAVEVRYHADIGAVRVFGRDAGAGPDVNGQAHEPGATPTAPVLVLDLSVDAGQIEVTR